MSVVFAPFAKWYFGKLTSKLSKLGLQFHDAIADNGVHELALSRLPAKMQAERARRIKRAIDLSAKHEEIPTESRENPWSEFKEADAIFSATQREVDEKKHIAGKYWMPYHLGRDKWFGYDTKEAWFFNKKSVPPPPGKLH